MRDLELHRIQRRKVEFRVARVIAAFRLSHPHCCCALTWKKSTVCYGSYLAERFQCDANRVGEVIRELHVTYFCMRTNSRRVPLGWYSLNPFTLSVTHCDLSNFCHRPLLSARLPWMKASHLHNAVSLSTADSSAIHWDRSRPWRANSSPLHKNQQTERSIQSRFFRLTSHEQEGKK